MVLTRKQKALRKEQAKLFRRAVFKARKEGRLEETDPEIHDRFVYSPQYQDFYDQQRGYKKSTKHRAPNLKKKRRKTGEVKTIKVGG